MRTASPRDDLVDGSSKALWFGENPSHPVGADECIAALSAIGCVAIWVFRDAPKQFRELSLFGGEEESVIFVPASILEADGELDYASPALSFIDYEFHHLQQAKFAGDEWGRFTRHVLGDKSIVLITKGAVSGGK